MKPELTRESVPAIATCDDCGRPGSDDSPLIYCEDTWLCYECLTMAPADAVWTAKELEAAKQRAEAIDKELNWSRDWDKEEKDG